MKKGIPHEGLKLLACVTMLLDHVGAVFVPGYALRIIGRLAFPLYCFLLVEGIRYTRSPARYGIRLGINALLSELPFELLFFGAVTIQHQSVMVTLLLGFLAVIWAKKMGSYLLPLLVCFLAAELLGADYGGWGVALIVLFAATDAKPFCRLFQTIGMAIIFLCIGSISVPIGAFRVPIQLFGVASMIPICLYSGRKATKRRAVQWCFYLFYPIHLLALLLITLA